MEAGHHCFKTHELKWFSEDLKEKYLIFFFSFSHIGDPDIEGSEQIKTTTQWGVGVRNLSCILKERHRLRKKLKKS